MPNGTYGGVRGWGREAPAYSIWRKEEKEDRLLLAKGLGVVS